MSKQKFGDYFVGLDIGTNSVGWAVTNPAYKVLKFNNKSMWGVRMFDAANTAEERRVFRTNRRRLKRRNYRLEILKGIFENELNKTDSTFLLNLKEGSLHKEDKSTDYKHTLFNDSDYIDDNYHEKYPTIYHLREELIDNNEAHDIREVYLAIHHIMKYRGHFLFDGELKSDNNINEALNVLNDTVLNIFDQALFDINDSTIEEIKEVLKNSELTVRDRTNQLKVFIHPDTDKELKRTFDKIVSLIAGTKLSNVLDIFPEIETEEKVALDFKSSSVDEDLDKLTMLDFDQMQLIEYAKAIYDWGLLEEIRDGEKYISVAKIKSYKQHGEDLAELKRIILEGAGRDVYNDFFHDEENKSNYAAYVSNGQTKTATAEDFHKAVRKVLDSVKGFEKEKETINEKIATNHYMPKQRIGSNGVIPHQLHLLELEQILENAKTYLPFLNDVDESGFSNAEKIVQTFKFRIPYYVGPLNPYHAESNGKEGTAWVVRTDKKGKVYPWNFNEMIDVSASAEKFITKMTNQCSYLLNEDVLPKHSLLYQKYNVLNEINNLKTDGNPISVEIKQHLFEDLFVKQHRNITKKQITKWLMDNNYVSRDDEVVVTGIDDQIKSKLTTYHDMEQIFDGKLPDTEVLDTIVYWITLFSDSKDILEKKIREEYGDLFTEEEIKRLRNKNYGGWGRLSRMLLEGLADHTNFPEPTSIIQALYIENYNLMELLSNQFEYTKQIEEYNQKEIEVPKELDYSLVDQLPISPSVKRPVWQTIKIMDELTSITGKAPEKIFVEVARGGGVSGQRTQSRKNQLIELYKNIKEDTELLGQLENTDEASLRSKKLYLYYTQRGKCMYSGEPISISQLNDENVYDLDHIYPRSVTKDDSLNNMVLVKKNLNQRKGNTYPLNEKLTITPYVYGLWRSLKDQGLISNSKYERLIRKDELTDAEKAGFIARQLVETRQSTKTIANIFKQLYPDTEIVFVKAGLVSDFRNDQKNHDKETGELRNPEYRHFIKLRNLNDFHHAKDAYLNIVVGNVYHTKFTSNPLNYIQDKKRPSYNLARMFDWKVERHNKLAWIPGLEGSIKNVNKMMKRHDILTTWMVTDGKGGLFKQEIKPKGKGKALIKKDKPIEKYGGYDSVKIANLVLVEHISKGKAIRNLYSIPIYIVKQNTPIIDYLSERYNINQIRIIKEAIPINNSIFEFDNRRVRVTGSLNRNTRYYYLNYIQPIYSDSFVEYYKRIEKILDPSINTTFEREKITVEIYKSLFIELLSMAKKSFFNDATEKYIDKFEEEFDNILGFDDEKKAKVLIEITKIIRGNNDGSDLRAIGLGKNIGVRTIGYNVSNYKAISLINQSITGLFENRVDLLQ